MDISWADVVVPAVVAVLISPLVQYLVSRRSAQAQGAFEARREFYDELLTNLASYVDYVKWLPPNARTPQPGHEDAANRVAVTPRMEIAMRLHASPTLRVRINERGRTNNRSARWLADPDRDVDLHI
jgi:hypothetical protein